MSRLPILYADSSYFCGNTKSCGAVGLKLEPRLVGRWACLHRANVTYLLDDGKNPQDNSPRLMTFSSLLSHSSGEKVTMTDDLHTDLLNR